MRTSRLALVVLAGLLVLVAGPRAFAQDAAPPAAWSVSDCQSCHEQALGPAFNQTAHGQMAQSCTSCHTAHRVLPRSDASSSVNPRNLPATCGRCHHGIQEEFQKSIHSASVSKAGKPLPICSDCHTAHTIRRTDETGFKLAVMDTCGRCHEDVSKSYFDTYHGKVAKLGYTKTAKCYDCHGAHDILPVSDPASSLSRQNVVTTAAVHGERRASYRDNASSRRRSKPLLAMIWQVYSPGTDSFQNSPPAHSMMRPPAATSQRRNPYSM